MTAFPVDGLYASIIGNQNVDFAAGADAFGTKGFLNALADNTADSKFLQTELLKYQIDSMCHVSFSSYIVR